MSVQIVAFVNQSAQLMLQFWIQKAEMNSGQNLKKVFISLAKHNKKKDPPEDSDKFKDEKNKFEKFFQENIK